MTPSVLWFRRDLRLSDHPALLAATDAGGGDVVGLFVLDDHLRRPAGANRLAVLYRSLRSLDEDMGGRLVVRVGDPVIAVSELAEEVSAGSIHVSADFGPYGSARDAAVERALGDDTPFVRTGSPYCVDPGGVRKSDGSPFRVFTPFYRSWKPRAGEPPADAPADVRWCEARTVGVPPDPEQTATLPPAGEAAAHARLSAFLCGVHRYSDDRDAPYADGTSKLSMYMKYGCIHPRQILSQLGRGAGDERFRSEVAWREFYADVLWHHPESARQPLQASMASMVYDEGEESDALYLAWMTGRTGYPIVDAGMRQLVNEGWMHNRVRMITASFLVKDLHLDWRRGARFFLHHLADGDLASNHHGWQWVAGTGTDPAPYYRVFNPVLQGEKFDPEGAYVRRYLPELRNVPERFVHHPWDDPGGMPDGYPARVVDHATERQEALVRYRALPKGSK